MDRDTLEQLRGAKDLIQEGVDLGAVALADVQRNVAHRVYAILGHAPLISRPSRAVEGVQQAITDVVYSAIRGVNDGVGDSLGWLLDQWATRLPQGDETP